MDNIFYIIGSICGIIISVVTITFIFLYKQRVTLRFLNKNGVVEKKIVIKNRVTYAKMKLATDLFTEVVEQILGTKVLVCCEYLTETIIRYSFFDKNGNETYIDIDMDNINLIELFMKIK